MHGLRPHERPCARESHQFILDGRPPCGIDRQRSREHDAASSGKPAERFAEKPPGKEVAAAVGIGGIHGDDVERASQPPVLKAIVKDRHRGRVAEGCFCNAGCPNSVGDMRHARQQHAELGGFVAGAFASGRVAPADNRGLLIQLDKLPCNPGNQRGFAGASQR